MLLDLTDEQVAALARLLPDTIDGDCYPLSARIRTLKDILDELEPLLVRETPLP